MNKSQLLVAPDAIQYLSPDDQKYAQIYLKKEYPGIIYHSEIDSYEYRGIMFDYFKSGTRFDLNGSLNGNGSYLLIDKEIIKQKIDSKQLLKRILSEYKEEREDIFNNHKLP